MDITGGVVQLLAAHRSSLPSYVHEAIARGDSDAILEALASLALSQTYTVDVFSIFASVAPELCARFKSHDLIDIVAAYGRILDGLPHLAEQAAQCFAQQRDHDLLSPLVRIIDDERFLTQAQELLLGVLRLLRFKNELFAEYVRPAILQLLLSHSDRCIRYLAVRVLCLYLHASDTTLEELLHSYLGDDEVVGQLDSKIVDFTFFELWEERRIKTFSEAQDSTALSNGTDILLADQRVVKQASLSPKVTEIAGVVLYKSQSTPNRDLRDDFSLIETPSTRLNLHSIASALQDAGPLLLLGTTGAGKTTLVNYVAQKLERLESMITLHLNEQSDAKLLIGVYSTGPHPGSFQWQPGVLTKAVIEGRWIFIEDLDRVPLDIMATLLPLIERNELSIPSRGEVLAAAPGFKIIATMRTNESIRMNNRTMNSSRFAGIRLWQQIMLQTPIDAEVQDIVTGVFPALRPLVARVMGVFVAVRTMTGRKSSSARLSVSLRELLRWCHRINTSLAASGDHKLIPDNVYDSFFLDAFDCFAGSADAEDHQAAIAAAISQQLHIEPDRVQHLLYNRRISLRTSKESHAKYLFIGRIALQISTNRSFNSTTSSPSASPFSLNPHSLRLLEKVAAAVKMREPLLLVGETGIGKTTAVQQLATTIGQHLVAINLSQQSEVGDILGGFKPFNVRTFGIPLRDEFDQMFNTMFSNKKNARFIEQLNKSIAKSKWKTAVSLWRQALVTVSKAYEEMDVSRPASDDQSLSSKRRKISRNAPAVDPQRWESFSQKLDVFEHQVLSSSQAMAFSFVEGKLINAVRSGHWVLLDEINLAAPDVLESLSDLLDSGPNARPSIMLTESGAVERIEPHPHFRVFAAMNPATDVGKKDLPPGVRSRFTELYVQSPDTDRASLEHLVDTYLSQATYSAAERKLSSGVADLYQAIQRMVTEAGLVDGSGQKPHYSIRTLTRALTHANTISPLCTLKRAVFEGFSMCFLTVLDSRSEKLLRSAIEDKIFGDKKTRKSELGRPLRTPDDGTQYVSIDFEVASHGTNAVASREQCWLRRGELQPEDPADYIVTSYICRNLLNLVRAASTRKYPILIQGPTSAGKTSMVEYLARRSGNTFVRINNHEHTDLQEYLGSYVSTGNGQVFFQEGILVQALRQGHWIVLDELNLAPTDVLEALNRLLDDNRELLIPETQEIVRPHPGFMLFATQNPAGPYGGRKVLSRAFRNRFLELHFDDIPIVELNTILTQRSRLPESWCAMIVEVFKRLSRLRQESRIFEHNSFATLRDLFRWAFRGADDVGSLARNGYMLLAEKARKPEDRSAVGKVIEEVMSRKGVRISTQDFHTYNLDIQAESMSKDLAGKVSWTNSMRRLYTLVSHAIRHHEAVLLVGETGCGKTTICQLLAALNGKPLWSVNAHENTETGDIIGAQRPIRNRALISARLDEDVRVALKLAGATLHSQLPGQIQDAFQAFKSLDETQLGKVPEELQRRVQESHERLQMHFEWQDGAIVQAMKAGHYFLLDEISLADDSVLERLNSVLDPSRTLLLAEKGSDDPLIVAQEGFQFFATMNPGGDYGKKELSPALRNRFTEIWVPSINEAEDVIEIITTRLPPSIEHYAGWMVSFAQWFSDRYRSFKETSISIRDVLAWADLINVAHTAHSKSFMGLVQGAAMVYIDTLGANPSAVVNLPTGSLHSERETCVNHLGSLTGEDCMAFYSSLSDYQLTEDLVRLGPFSIPIIGSPVSNNSSFSFEASTTKINTARVIRGLQLEKPILIEGAPGVGKTSTITALSRLSGHHLVRINLSEQTDLMDLFGSDVPVENAAAGRFSWRDGPFLNAMKQGHWVLLDEMNLASQSILEGLNAVLDHRGEVYIPELDQVFPRHPKFRLFAAQNPHLQGGGRKGLPASFVNRFTVVYADAFNHDDLRLICHNMFPAAQASSIDTVVTFVDRLAQEVNRSNRFGTKGSPWEFNLRDVLRCLQLVDSEEGLLPAGKLQDFFRILFYHRFRTATDMLQARTFAENLTGNSTASSPYITLDQRTMQVGLGLLPRSTKPSTTSVISASFSVQQLPIAEAVLVCIAQKWPVLLTGPSGCGKTRLLQSIAAVAGARVETLSLNADIDANDLLGGFEQVDNARFVQEFVGFAEAHLRQLILHLAVLNEPPIKECLKLLLNLEVMVKQLKQDHTLLAQVCKSLIDASRCFENEYLEHLVERCQTVLEMPQAIHTARFQWVDGTLVRALEQGHWLILDNANLCSSSVLDRLNSLLEPNGSLMFSERTTSSGQAQELKPHPEFRVFLTYDPQYGEISRAMRNRAVELFMPLPQEPDMFCAGGALSLEAKMSRLQPLTRFLSNPAHHQIPHRMTFAAFERLSSADMKIFDRYRSQILAGLLGSTLLTKSSLAMDFMLRHDVMKDLEPIISKQLYSPLTRAANLTEFFYEALPIHPFQNSQLVLLNPETFNQALCLGVLFDLAQQTRTLATLISDRKASNSSLTNVTLTSRPAQRNAKRMLSADAEVNSIMVADAVVDSIAKWLHEEIQQFPASPFSKATKRIKSVVQHLLAFVQILESSEPTSSPFKGAYIDVLESFITKISGQSEELHGLITLINSKLRDQRSRIKSHTGRSMERLWSRLSPPNAFSESRLGSMGRLGEFMDDFDATVWQSRAPLQLLQSAQHALLESYNLVRQQDVADGTLSDTLSHAEEALRAVSGSDGDAISPVFADVFNAVFQKLALKSKPSSNTDFEMLALLARRSTKSFAMGSHTEDVVLHKFGHLLSSGESSNGPPLAITMDVGLRALQLLTSLSSVPLAHFSLLQQETSYLARVLAQRATLVESDCLPTLVSAQQDLWLFILQAHDDQVPSSFSSITSLAKSLLQNSTDLHASSQISSMIHDYQGSDGEVMSAFRSIFEAHLSPQAIRSLSVPALLASDVADDLTNTALAFIALFVSDTFQDPADRPVIERKIYEQQHTVLLDRITALETVELFQTGQNASMRTQEVRIDLESLGAGPPEIMIFRSDKESVGDIQQLFSNVLRICERVRALFKVEPLQEDQAIFVLDDIEMVIKRLGQGFSSYSDIIKPVTSSLHCVSLGIRLKLRSQTAKKQRFSQMSYLENMTPFISDKDARAWFVADLLPEASGRPSNSTRMRLLQTIAVKQSIQPTPGLVRIATAQVDFFHEYWKVHLEQDQKSHAKNSRFYEYKGGSDDEDSSVEDDEFHSIFPTYEASTESEAASRPRSGDSMSPSEVASNIARLHLSIFLKPGTGSNELLQLFLDVGGDLGRDLADSTQHGFGSTRVLPLVLLSLDTQLQKWTEAVSSSDTYNIYTDANYTETARLRSLIYEIEHRVRQVLESWPEHATLHNILLACRELLLLGQADPVMKYLGKLEHLHGYIYEWQSVASREFSVSNILDKVSTMIVSWRRLELTTWAHLLDLEARKAEQAAFSWFLLAYSNVIHAEATNASHDSPKATSLQMVTVLQDFLTSSTLSQFAPKLDMLRSMLLQLRATAMDDFLSSQKANAIANLVAFYERFEGSIQDAISSGKAELEKQLRDVVKLATWKDTNINALRQSARTSHRKLFRLVRRYRELLNQPVSPLLAISAPQTSKPGKVMAIAAQDRKIYAHASPVLLYCQGNTQAWDARPFRYKNVENTARRIGRLVMDSFKPLEVSGYITDFLSGLTASAEHLKKATPAFLTEQNSSQINHLSTRKRKLFADTLKDLRQMGLKSSVNAAIVTGQDTVAKVLSVLSDPSYALNDEVLRESDAHFLGLLDIMGRVRGFARRHSEDLTASDVSRSIGYLENILSFCISQRKIISESSSSRVKTLELISTIDSLWQEECALSLPSLHTPDIASISSCVAYMVPILKTAITILEAQAKLGTMDLALPIDGLATFANAFEALSTEVKTHRAAPRGLTYVESKTLTNKALTQLEKLRDSVNSWISQYPQACVVLDHVLTWAYPLSQNGPSNPSTEASETQTLADFELSLYSYLDDLLSTVQAVSQRLGALPGSVDDDSWFSSTDHVLRSALEAFRQEQLLSNFHTLLESLYSTATSHSLSLSYATASVVLISPILSQYNELHSMVLNHFKVLHRSTCEIGGKLSHLFCQVADNGYCKPAEKSQNENSKETEQLEGGTGLGEGEGAEDISKEIGADEDLTELAQTEETQAKDAQMQENEDAIDVDAGDELKGGSGAEKDGNDDNESNTNENDAAPEEASQQTGDEANEDTEQGQGCEGEDDDAIDEVMGKIDDSEVPALDEKFWDEPSNEAEKEQEGQQAAKEASKDEQAASKEPGKEIAEDKQDGDSNSPDEVDIGSDDKSQDEMAVAEPMVPHPEEVSGLDLPEDLKLDGDKEEDEALSDDDVPDNTEELDNLGQDGESLAGDPADQSDPEDDPNQSQNNEEGNIESAEDKHEDTEDVDAENTDSTAAIAVDTNNEHTGDEFDTGAGTGAFADAEQDAPCDMSDEEAEAMGVEDMAKEEQQASAASAQRQQGEQTKTGKRTGMGEANMTDPDETDVERRDTKAMKTLGDIFERWHRQHKQIQEPGSEQQLNQSDAQDQDMADAEFEHLPDGDAEADTQALGAATQEQARPVDQRLGLQTDQNADEQSEPAPAADDESIKDIDMLDFNTSELEQETGDNEVADETRIGSKATFELPTHSKPELNSHENSDDDSERSFSAEGSDQGDDEEPKEAIQSTVEDPAALWQQHEVSTHSLSLSLTEQLRLILAPTLATKLRGDFRTGKRLNIKRIIPYIASQYKRDKIWMRRSVPSKRSYQILLAIDDSKSMGENGSASLALDTLALVANSLKMLEVGQLGVVGFGEKVNLVHELGGALPWNAAAGAEAVRRLTFQQTRTDVKRLVRSSIDMLREARMRNNASGPGGADLWQLQLIISDGICEDHEGIRRLLLETQEERIMIVFVVVDSAKSTGGKGASQSIADLVKVDFVQSEGGDGGIKVQRTQYLETFPFGYYLIVKDVQDLPGVLAAALRQWFAEVSEQR